MNTFRFPVKLALASTLAATSAMAIVPGAAVAVPAGGYADLVEDLSPGVVYIEVSSTSPAEMQLPALPRGMDQDEFMRRFGPLMPNFRIPNPEPARGLGTGFIISQDGQIVTNNHVIDGASAITVTLSDGKVFDAEVIGTDPLTDVALIKIDADVELTPLEFGSSSEMRPGDEVLAIGNPFGLQKTRSHSSVN